MKGKLPGCTVWLILGAALLLVPEFGMAAAAPFKAGKSAPKTRDTQQVPIVVTSERMEANDADKTVVFSGNVIAEKGALTIYSDRMEVYNNKENNKISRIVAVGNVRIVQEGKNATGERAVYYDDEQKVVLTGNPKAWEGDNVVTGSEITSYLNENRSVVKGSPGTRVRAIIVPTEDDRKRVGGSTAPAKTEEKK